MLVRRFPRLLTSIANPIRTKVPVHSLNPLQRAFIFNFSENKAASKKMQFKAETKKLLDIVAKSLYTDSEVFLRQLLSNASDALEKQKFKFQNDEDLHINVEISPTKGQVIIQDNGVGMTQDQLIDNLGTIAKSGSKQFVESLLENPENKAEIIGQFGVGFYSSFIVSDRVQVISKVENGPAHSWTSDGDGLFEIEEIDDTSFERGTKIILHIKDSDKHFLEKKKIQQIIQKYSNFINYPIAINGQTVNIIKAMWTRDKKQISDEEYLKFYHFLTNKSENYQYKMHFASDVPFMIKSILYIPKSHTEKFGIGQEQGEVSLYSKKILIKKNCKDILIPGFLRFVKGVVDCEDIPLNISRQNYQDSALMHKLKVFLTKRILKFMKEEAAKNPQAYNKWYSEFSNFIKEGSLDPEFKKDVIDLNRFEITSQDGFRSLKDYMKLKTKTQDRIFYMFSPNKTMAKDSPYMYPLSKAKIPVVIANTHIDEIIFREIDTFDGLRFANIETDHEDVERALRGVEGDSPKEEIKNSKIKEEEITTFSLWIKNELQPFVDKVVVSKKKISGSAMVISPVSSSMRQMSFMKQMMDENVKSGAPRADLRNLTFEYNPNDELIAKLNQYRKVDMDAASMVIRQIFDNCCMECGIESDAKNMIRRVNHMMNTIVEGGLARNTIEDKGADKKK